MYSPFIRKKINFTFTFSNFSSSSNLFEIFIQFHYYSHLLNFISGDTSTLVDMSPTYEFQILQSSIYIMFKTYSELNYDV